MWAGESVRGVCMNRLGVTEWHAVRREGEWRFADGLQAGRPASAASPGPHTATRLIDTLAVSG